MAKADTHELGTPRIGFFSGMFSVVSSFFLLFSERNLLATTVDGISGRACISAVTLSVLQADQSSPSTPACPCKSIDPQQSLKTAVKHSHM